MKKLLSLVSVFLITTQLFAQQSWQWGKRGGGGKNEYSVGGTPESVVDMAVDVKGNVYTLSNVLFHQNDVNVDGHALSGKYIGLVISSFSCSGTYRWAKVISSSSDDRAIALRADTLGGIYITGTTNGVNLYDSTYFGSDTAFGQSYKTMFLVKYDTAGNYKWLRRPQPDTATYSTVLQSNYTLDMDVDKAGSSYSMCYLSKGLYGTGNNAYSVTNPGVYMLRYDRNGNFSGGNTMAITIPSYNGPVSQWWLNRTPSGNFIVNGTPSGSGTSLTFGTTSIISPGFVASLNSNGTLNWVKQSALSYSNNGNTILNKSVVDAQGSVYISGSSIAGDAFGGTIFSNPISFAGTPIPIALKLDSNGNTLWGKWGNGEGAYGLAGALNTNGEFVLGGSWGGLLKWPGTMDSIVHPPGWYAHIFLTRFNAQTGAFIKMDTLYSPPSDNNIVTAMAADKKGNVFIGGSFQSEIKVAGATLTAVTGGYFDFFVTKYGAANCNCTPPVASFTKSNQNNTVRSVVFQYTGTTVGLDSLVWVWGNGQRLRLTGNYTGAITQYYDTGMHNVCVTAYATGCGSTTSCQSIYFAPVGINEVPSAGSAALVLIPNPATTSTRIDYKFAEGTKSGSLELFDLLGRRVASQQLHEQVGNWTVDLANLPAGTYLVVLRQNGGGTLQTKLVINH